MKKILKNKWVILGIVLIVGIAIGRWVTPSANQANNESDHQHTHSKGKQESNQIWTCSMHPQIQKDGPGDCPICGMDLIPVDNTVQDEATLPDEVPMSESAMKLAEIQTYVVKSEKPEKEIRLLGKVKADERLMYSQAIHFPGRIEKLFINFTGEKVTKGQKLATVYSSELVTAQKELFEVLKDEATSPALVEAAREKLKQWKFTEEQITNLEKSGDVQYNVDVLSDYSGYVMMRMVSEGDHFKEGQALFEITDLSKVWVLFEAYENDLPWIKMGDEFEIDIKSVPSQTFTGKVTFIDPFINPKTRVAYVRVELQNASGKLKPDMFANGLITSKLPIKEEMVLAPKSAVLWTGKRAVVYVKIPNRKHTSFIYREVILGEDAGDFYIIQKGLKDGEEIASNGVFKIDASAQLAGKKSMMNPTGGKSATGGMAGMDMGGNDEKDDMAGMDMSEKEMNVMIDKSTIPSKFKKQLGNVVSEYLELKDKLVNDNSKVKSNINSIQNSLIQVDMSLLSEEGHKEWMRLLSSMNKDLKRLLNTENIKEQRKLFLTLSNSIYKSSKTFGVKMENDETLYLEFCPMADNNNGGFWLSKEREIRNPYFGSSMLKCGSVKEIITNN